jgi:hypothetical protein
MSVKEAYSSFAPKLIEILTSAYDINWNSQLDLPLEPIKFDFGQDKITRHKFGLGQHELFLDKNVWIYTDDTGMDMFTNRHSVYLSELSKYFLFKPFELNEQLKTSYNWFPVDERSSEIGKVVKARKRYYRVHEITGPRKNQLFKQGHYTIFVSEKQLTTIEFLNNGVVEGMHTSTNESIFQSTSICHTRAVSRGVNQIDAKWAELFSDMEGHLETNRQSALVDLDRKLRDLLNNDTMFNELNELSAKVSLLTSLSSWYYKDVEIPPSYIFQRLSLNSVLFDWIHDISLAVNKKKTLSKEGQFLSEVINNRLKSHCDLLMDTLNEVEGDYNGTIPNNNVQYLLAALGSL